MFNETWLMCEKMIVFLATKIYDYMLILPRVPRAAKSTKSAKLIKQNAEFRNNMPTTEKKFPTSSLVINIIETPHKTLVLTIARFFIIFYQY